MQNYIVPGRQGIYGGRSSGCLLEYDAILQAHQGNWTKVEGSGLTLIIKKLCQATDLCLHAIKEMAYAVGHTMSALVATERHLWLNLSGIKERGQNIPP